ncbi:MAG TPA: xanthine dehydrogenase family protein molybdopterin-binding subunit [Dehalococcoidia bacterium]|nr:xanthine dehydrogenase family protein molybdopterin-binding subunit [Dehalococcoidia bacterium]HIK89924.1 xanthine dehydrogenase family protein molybdopterin-binding subunit [Dehalococcoidia bacterium]
MSVEGSVVSIERVDVAFDCGKVFNPEGARNQIEGSVVMGLGTALWEAVEFDGGRVLSNGFGAYRVPRITDVPEINVEFIDDPTDDPSGAGEPGIVPIAAAIANAVVDATGVVIDRLPIEPQL